MGWEACCMNSVTPWMNAGTPDVVTVMEGAPAGPAPGTPATPRRDPRSWRRSGARSWGSPPPLLSVWFWVDAADGGFGPEVEKEKEEEEV